MINTTTQEVSNYQAQRFRELISRIPKGKEPIIPGWDDANTSEMRIPKPISRRELVQKLAKVT